MAKIRPKKQLRGGVWVKVWQLDYQDPKTGKRHRPQFDTKREADKERVRVESEIVAGVHVPASESLTVLQIARAWVGSIEDLVRAGLREESTVEKYRQHVEKHISAFAIAGTKLSRLTGGDCDSFAHELATKLSQPMAKKVWGSFKMALSFAVRRDKLRSNPALSVKLPTSARVGSEDDRVEIPSKPALRAILAASQRFDNTGRVHAYVHTRLFTGMRQSEMFGAPWAAFTLAGTNPHVKVVQRADSYRKLGPPKSKSGRRKLPLGPETVRLLKEWKLACPKGKEGLAFPNSEGGVQSESNFWNRIWVPLLLAAQSILEADPNWDSEERLIVVEIDGEPVDGDLAAAIAEAEEAGRKVKLSPCYGPNCLRHAAASLWIEQGLTPKQLKERMGHAQISLTYDLYGHLFVDPEGDQQIASAIERDILGSAR